MTYTTKAGDAWDLIAYQQLGDEKYVPNLIDANRQHVETFIFHAGVELTLPDITEEQKVTKLPTWRSQASS